MRRLLTGYAVKFNHRHKRTGKLFQNRYKSILCQEDPYLLELVRYIHLNPLRDGLVNDYAKLGHFKYCGHSYISGNRENDWQDVDYVLSLFAKRKKTAIKRCLEHVRKGIKIGKRPDLTGGGSVAKDFGFFEHERLSWMEENVISFGKSKDSKSKYDELESAKAAIIILFVKGDKPEVGIRDYNNTIETDFIKVLKKN